MASKRGMELVAGEMEQLFGLFEEAGISLTEEECEAFKQGMWNFGLLNVGLFNWSMLGDLQFEEAAPRRFAQLWHAFVKRNAEFVSLMNRLKQALQESARFAAMQPAEEA